MDRAGGTQPDYVGLARLGVRHLAIFGAIVLSQVPNHLADIRDTGRTERMPLGEQSTGNVDRRFAAARIDAPV